MMVCIFQKHWSDENFVINVAWNFMRLTNSFCKRNKIWAFPVAKHFAQYAYSMPLVYLVHNDHFYDTNINIWCGSTRVPLLGSWIMHWSCMHCDCIIWIVKSWRGKCSWRLGLRGCLHFDIWWKRRIKLKAFFSMCLFNAANQMAERLLTMGI